MSFVKCLECGARLKRISNTHLFRCSKLTMQEYALKHGLAVEQLVTQEVKNQMARSLKNKSPEEKQLILDKLHNTLKEKFSLTLTSKEEQIILGSLLGDGYLFQGKKQPWSTYLVLEHGIKQLDYLLWKGRFLERLNAKFYQYFKYNQVKQRMTAYNQVRTSSFPLFGEYAKKFYWAQGKKVPREDVMKLGPLGLTVWYLDDGSVNFNQAYFCTQAFDKDDNYFLKDMLKIKFKIDADVLHSGDGFYLRLLKDATKRLFKIIKPHIIPQMLYKIKESWGGYIRVCKTLPLDASHFLTDYPGKCSNLHGGRWQLSVYVKGPINPETGMVIDYTYLKRVMKEYIIDKLDHHCINLAVPELGWRSTTELMCIWIWFTLVEVIPGLERIRLYETPDSFTDYTGPSTDELKKNKNHPDLLLLKHFQDPKTFQGRIIENFDKLYGGELFDDTEEDQR
jgi:6-pyruvoyl tetrahydropterin synthase/QueD family protein